MTRIKEAARRPTVAATDERQRDGRQGAKPGHDAGRRCGICRAGEPLTAKRRGASFVTACAGAPSMCVAA